MRRRIEQLLNGVFEYETPAPVLSVSRIEAESEDGNLISGSFMLTSPSDRKVKGVVYSSSPRVTMDPARFTGRENKVQYQADLTGLREGDVCEGAFTICTDLGEVSVPFCFRVRGPHPENAQKTEAEEVLENAASPADALAKLASADPDKARALFMKADFARLLKEKTPKEALVYDAVVDEQEPSHSLEEFLVGCGKKELVEITADTEPVKIDAPAGSIRLTLLLHASHPGFLRIHADSDTRFIRLEKKDITTDEFVGGSYPLEYIIDTNFLHAGRNYGRLKIETSYQTLTVDIQADRSGQSERARRMHVQGLMRKKMLTLYLDFRLGRIEMSTWIERTLNVIGGYRRAGGDDVFADLFMAQLYYADGKITKGSHILDELEKQPGRFHTQEQYAFYLYISTFFEKDSAYVDQVEARITQIFLKERDSWIIQWILLYLQERYLKDASAKLDAIALQVQYGCSSPIMYMEAAQIFKKDPYMLHTLGPFEVRILLFAAKEHMITEELAYRISTLVMQAPKYDEKMLRILMECYQVTKAKDVLGAICAILIAGEKKDTKYFSWYSLGVSEDLHLTGLYEYYMETMDTVGIEKMPQVIRLYFSYNNNLGYHRKAAIYRNISDNRENVPAVYRNMRQGIEHFVIEQLSLGRIDEDLAVLYERFLTRKMLTQALASNLVKLLFTFEVTCKNPRMKSVIVMHSNLKQPQEVPLTGGMARVQIYSEDARLFLADDQGRRYASTALYMARRYLDSPLLITWCRQIVPDHPGLTLYITGRGGAVSGQELPYYKKAEKMDGLTDSFRNVCRQKILRYYKENPMEKDLFGYLSTADMADFIRADKGLFVTLLTQEGMYEKAFEALETYGAEQLDVTCLVRICSQMVLAREYEEDRTLLAYCYQCFVFGKYNDNILTYLLTYYDGPIEDMKRLWVTGSNNELDTMALEEKILTVVLFSGSGSEATEPIFLSYEHKLGRRRIGQAYLNMKSYEYLVKNLPVADGIFEVLEKDYESGREMEDVCHLALLQYYSGLPSLTQEQYKNARELLMQYNARGIRFDFYERFPVSLTLPCLLEDKVFLEYVADPAHTVTLFYRIKGTQEKFRQETMKDVFEGIFVKEFVLFEGEQLECYLEESDSQEKLVKKTDLRTLSARIRDRDKNSRYGLICQMSMSDLAGDEETLRTQLNNFYEMDYLTQEIFTIV